MADRVIKPHPAVSFCCFEVSSQATTPLRTLESCLIQWLGCADWKTREGESTDGDLAVHQHRKEPVAEFGEFFVLQ